MKTQITGHFILYEVFHLSTGKVIGEFVIARDEQDQKKAIKTEMVSLAKESGIRIAYLQYRAQGKH